MLNNQAQASLDTNDSTLNELNPDLQKNTDELIRTTVTKAKRSQELISTWSDDSLDSLVSEIAKAVESKAATFARDTVEETGIGCVSHKVHKLSLVHTTISKSLMGLKTIGKISTNETGSISEFASPIGIIFAVIPLTNPVPNSLFKSILSIKTRNALIISYPRTATKVGMMLIDLIQDILIKHGAPKYLIQIIPQPSSRELVNQFMQYKDIDLILATGGSGLVKAAYSSGNPCYGVGPGNVPAWITDDADLDNAAASIVSSKFYDNGIICGSENNLIVDFKVKNEFIEKLKKYSACVLSDNEKTQAISAWFDNGKLRREVLGKSANQLIKLANINRSYNVKICVIDASDNEFELLGGEKLAPVVSLFNSEGYEGVELSKRFLAHEGAGHTAVIHSDNQDYIDYFAEHIPAGRILVNTPSTFGMMGVSTDLPLSFMLGSGSWGGNLTTDAITWKHFLNIKRLATHTHDVSI